MGVDEVYRYLKKYKGFHSAQKIADKLDYNVKSIRESLNVISRYKDIICEYLHLIRNKTKKRVGLKTKRTWVYAHVNSIKKQRR